MLPINAFILEKPSILYTDQHYSVKPPAYNTIDNLLKSLQEYGPLVAVGKMGPSAYKKAPVKLENTVFQLEGCEEVYGWQPGTFKEISTSTEVLLLGAKKTGSSSHIYFTLAKDITNSESSLIRGFIPSVTDKKIYIMSYENFLNRSLINLHLTCPHAQWLYSVDVSSIIVDKEIREKCKQIGQQIFDQYKAASMGDSNAGRKAVVRICNAARVLTHDGLIRKSHIEYAWDGIGDLNWDWRK